MREPSKLLLLFFLSGLIAASPTRAQDSPPATVPGIVRERLKLDVTPEGGGPVVLDAMITRLEKLEKRPLVVWSHGTTISDFGRMETHAGNSVEAVMSFALRGWTVVSVVRRGYGKSGVRPADVVGDCRARDWPASAQAAAADVLAVLATLGAHEAIDSSRVAFAGISAGGFTSLAAAARQPQGLVAAWNFAGGSGSNGSGSLCRESELIEQFRRFGAATKVPTFWAYAENDRYFPPQVARKFHAAFVQAGGSAEFISIPEFGGDGHELMSRNGVALWRAPFDQFLNKNALPTWTMPVDILLRPIQPPSGASPDVLLHFKTYAENMGLEKAFAIGSRSRFGWVSGKSSREAAINDALTRCGSGCQIYAVNDELL
jgi:pimeloyl-ACP methyl ester carboxylesterase